MQTRKLGTNGPELSVIGFGAWAIGGQWIYGWGPVEDSISVKAIHAAIDLGVNWIDTAAAYGFGHSENVVGRALREHAGIFVATKCGLVSDGHGGAVRNSNPENIRRELEGSLKRLQREYVDLYQIHWPDMSVLYEDSWEMMIRLRDEGKVRFIGLSNYEIPEITRCMAIQKPQSLQPAYSILNRHAEEQILPFCQNNGMGVVVYSPMQSGLLTGRFDKRKLAPDDWRHESDMFLEPKLSANLRFVENLRPIARHHDATVGQIAVAWVLSNPAVTSAIVGARSEDQVRENVGAAGVSLTGDDLRKIRFLGRQFR